MELKEFTHLDWHCYAGANANDGTPLLGELKVDGKYANIIVDSDGIVISTFDNNFDPLQDFSLWCNFKLARFIASGIIREEMSSEALLEMGFGVTDESYHFDEE